MSSAGKPSSLQCSTTDSSKHTPSDSSTDPAAGILILIFIHCSISISYTFSFQDINQAVSLRFPAPLLLHAASLHAKKVLPPAATAPSTLLPTHLKEE